MDSQHDPGLNKAPPSWNGLVAAMAAARSRKASTSSQTPPTTTTAAGSGSRVPSPPLPRAPSSGPPPAPHIVPVTISLRQLQAAALLRPQGFANYGNMCFLNAILQCLLHNVALVNLFAKLAPNIRNVSFQSAPFLRSIAEVFALHEPMEKDQVGAVALPSGLEAPIAPESLYEMLRQRSNSRAFQGAQEDAQEFLTYLLDRLHQELLGSKKLLGWTLSDPATAKTGGEDGAGEWLEVGPKNLTSHARTMEHPESPISFLFFGRLRSIVKRPGVKNSITTEPFHCVSLDIQDERINSLADALRSLARPETVRTDGGALLTKQLLIERAPPILVLQLKRFVFDSCTGSISKLGRLIAYEERLDIDWQIVANPDAAAVYRLVAVCYHHGWSAEGGHYTCHVRQTLRDDDPWLFFDDSSISLEPLEMVLRGGRSPNQTAYLLIYQKHKTLR